MMTTGFDEEKAFFKASRAYDVDRTAKLLDEKYPRWSLYRTYDGRWGVQVSDQNDTHTIAGDNLAIVLQQAFEWRFLELVPRPPEKALEGDFRVIRPNEKEWELQFHEKYYSRFKTKKEAFESVQKRVAYSKKMIEGWESEFGWSQTKKEGIHFRWSSESYELGMKRLNPDAADVQSASEKTE